MSKIKNIIAKLSEHDYFDIYQRLNNENAEKSAQLLKYFREKKSTDKQIIANLKLTNSAFYTLRSRLNQKIEEFIVEKIEKNDEIVEVLFTQKKSVATIVLKNLEKKYIDDDNPTQLLKTYKHLMLLNVGQANYHLYENLYNAQYTHLQAVNNAEFQLAKYYSLFGQFYINNNIDTKNELKKINHKLNSISSTEKSHKLYVMKSFSNVFHRLFVLDENENFDFYVDDVNDIIDNLKVIFKNYQHIKKYQKLTLCLHFIEFEYYESHKMYKKSDPIYESVNANIVNLLANYNSYTFPFLFLISKINRNMRNGTLADLEIENNSLFSNFEYNYNNLESSYIYLIYRTLSLYYANNYEDSAGIINNFLNHFSLKNNIYMHIEIKTFLALQYCVLDDYELLNQLATSIQRQIRIVKKKNLMHSVVFIKILKTSIRTMNRRSKQSKIKFFTLQLKEIMPKSFSPLKYLQYDDDFVSRLTKF